MEKINAVAALIPWADMYTKEGLSNVFPFSHHKITEQTQNFQSLLCSPPFNNKEPHSDEMLLHQESLSLSQK